MAPEYLTIQEVAERLKVNPMTIRRAIMRKKLAAIRIGSIYRITETMVDDYLRRQTLKAERL